MTPLEAPRTRRARPPADQPRPQSLGTTSWAALRDGTLGPALVGSLLLALALPPAGLWPLAWVAPICWACLVQAPALPGRRPYRALWVAGICFWLAAIHWLRLPHPASYLGWLALSTYLGLYLPALVFTARIAVHRWSWPLELAMPVVWTGLELCQAHLLSGFLMGSIAHTQYRWLELIQIADLAGGYAVTFVIVLVASCLAAALPLGQCGWRPARIATAAVVLALVLGYGHHRLNVPKLDAPTASIALIQGSVDTYVKSDPSQNAAVFREYFELSRQARDSRKQIDLIVWPETMLRDPYLSPDADASPAPDDEWTKDDLRESVTQNHDFLRQMAKSLDAPLLLGVDTIQHGPGTLKRYNSALFVSRDGQIGPRYDKMHPVPFGEFVPLAGMFPWLYSLTPLGGGIECGTSTPVFRTGTTSLAANICYESVLSHVIRQQLDAQLARSELPDVLVNLTNDGWFHGSSELDLHLACGVFRAVECRMPFLIAANTGFSAWIDGDGRIVRQGKRHEQDWIVADVARDPRSSPYRAIGDLPAGLCLALTVVLAASGRGRVISAK